jgi:tetratricopeptide (TPR) repeat protein
LARSLFHKGVAFFDQGEWEQASDHLQRSLALRPSSVVAYNLALALEPQQRLIEASELLRSVVRDTTAEDQLRQASEERLDQMVPKIGALKVRLEGDATGVSVTLDSKPLLPEAIGIEVPVDPGSHTVVVLRKDEKVVSRSETVAEGEKREMVLTIPPQKPVQSADLSPKEATAAENQNASKATPSTYFRDLRDEEAMDSIFTSGWFWVGAGVVLAAVVTIAVVSDSSN